MSQINLLTSTVTDIERVLGDGTLTSQELVGQYLNQINHYNGYLHAIISTAPEEVLMKYAKALDDERAQGKIRSPLHGIPIVVKDNIATHPDLGMETTAGTFALVGSRVREGATVVNQLQDAGAIILAKSNLRIEQLQVVSRAMLPLDPFLIAFRGLHMPCGWSAVGGLTESPYVRGGKRWDDGYGGYSSPGGSSSGSAVAVAAGFAPVSIGTDTMASLLMPATRQDLYTLKPTIGTISQGGICPISFDFDSAGPMAKCARDIAVLMDVMIDPTKAKNVPIGGYTTVLTKSWDGIRIGVLEPNEWQLPLLVMHRVEEAEMQKEKEILACYEKLKDLGVSVKKVTVASLDELVVDGRSQIERVMISQFKSCLESYLAGLESSKVRTLEEVISFMKEHADLEMPEESPNIKRLETALEYRITPDEYETALAHMHDWGRGRAVDRCLEEFGVDVILGPGDSRMSELSSAAGYPIAALPLSYLDLNGRPFGLAAVSTAHSEALLIQLMSVWEVSFKGRRLPTEFSKCGG